MNGHMDHLVKAGEARVRARAVRFTAAEARALRLAAIFGGPRGAVQSDLESAKVKLGTIAAGGGQLDHPPILPVDEPRLRPLNPARTPDPIDFMD